MSHPAHLQHESDVSDSLEMLSVLFKAAGDPLRLEVLRVLQNDTFGVLELSNIFEVRQSGMSHHLKVLSSAGLLETQREGNSIFYRRPIYRRDDLANDVAQTFYELIDRIPLPASIVERVQQIRDQRAEQSQAFFTRYADKFREQQELIANYELYAEPTRQLLFTTPFDTDASALEIGPGEGAFLKTLAPSFKTVYALDNSEKMLAKARLFAQQEKLHNIEFMLGETRQALDKGIKVDAIILNMVLHHVSSPADIFKDSAKLLNPRGCLVVSDLSLHDQHWVRENCGDIWLGFDSSELTEWASKAGFEEEDSLYIGLRNGFQIQIKKFIYLGGAACT
ncbi:MAG: metalloregulator ArsR/SmtB family transcription factor [Hahellaceae bacterium]|nr:metalloregulator ArsR/SmtB family transcription factor [Hahellaceae bacterium]MCP5168727.1 metalloregulator ArsR/SmtB family transcription factor [Hahellaceae bacterium]